MGGRTSAGGGGGGATIPPELRGVVTRALVPFDAARSIVRPDDFPVTPNQRRMLANSANGIARQLENSNTGSPQLRKDFRKFATDVQQPGMVQNQVLVQSGNLRVRLTREMGVK